MKDRPEESGERLEPWMEAEVAKAMSPLETNIPVERMWARVSQAPRLLEGSAPAVRVDVSPSTPAPATRSWRSPALIAAGVLLGVAIGRFALPDRSAGSANPVASIAPAVATDSSRADRIQQASETVAGATTNPDADATSSRTARARRTPTITPVVAEHLQQTVAVLAAVRDGQHLTDADSATRRELQQLLTTTRQLLDEPGTRATRTHRLLQDLELVLAQLARAREAAPATRAAADEAMRETNLLPRLRAAAESRSGSEEP